MEQPYISIQNPLAPFPAVQSVDDLHQYSLIPFEYKLFRLRHDNIDTRNVIAERVHQLENIGIDVLNQFIMDFNHKRNLIGHFKDLLIYYRNQVWHASSQSGFVVKQQARIVSFMSRPRPCYATSNLQSFYNAIMAFNHLTACHRIDLAKEVIPERQLPLKDLRINLISLLTLTEKTMQTSMQFAIHDLSSIYHAGDAEFKKAITKLISALD